MPWDIYVYKTRPDSVPSGAAPMPDADAVLCVEKREDLQIVRDWLTLKQFHFYTLPAEGDGDVLPFGKDNHTQLLQEYFKL